MAGNNKKKLLIIEVAALGYDFLRSNQLLQLGGYEFSPLEPVFPALTCVQQASFRTACFPAEHGIYANGFYDYKLCKTFFWEQSARLITGGRIWENFRKNGGSVAMLFWQQSLGERADVILSPAPIHKHHGGIVDVCYSSPPSLYDSFCKILGKRFKLRNYWGPLASLYSSEWIADVTIELLKDMASPSLCLTYLPHLDYELQKYGPDSPKSSLALQKLIQCIKHILNVAEKNGYEFLLWGDYAMTSCGNSVVFPNRILLKNGFTKCREVKGRLYLDFYQSKAFTMVDHQVAFVFFNDATCIEEVKGLFHNTNGVASVFTAQEIKQIGLPYPACGELVLTADENTWFAYPWWEDPKNAPDFAFHVDIHNKPGYDPCELFWGWPPGSISMLPYKIHGTHGLIGKGHEAAWVSSFLKNGRIDLVGLAKLVEEKFLSD